MPRGRVRRKPYVEERGTPSEGDQRNAGGAAMSSNRRPRPLGPLVLSPTFVLLFVLAGGWSGLGSPSGSSPYVVHLNTFGPTPVVNSTSYSISFPESGLWDCTYWWVTMGNSTARGGTYPCVGGTPEFDQPNGTYPYSVKPIPGYTVTPSSGNVTVAGTNVSINLTFTRVLYPVSALESGLPLGSTWYLNISPTWNYGPSYTSTGSVLSFHAANGTWWYNSSAPGYHAAGGSFTVNASLATLNITFLPGAAPLYALNFTETGWPNESIWGAAVYNTSQFAVPTGNASFITFYLPDGTYPYSLCWGSTGPFLCPTSLHWETWSVVIQGASVTVPTRWITPTYSTTFRETGLRSGESWLVVLDGTPHRTNRSSITFQLSYGNHTYLIEGPAGRTVTGVPPAGVLSITAATNESVVFRTGRTYSMAFARTGLLRNETWCVTLQGLKDCTANTTLRFSPLSAGTYTYTVRPMTGQTIAAKLGNMTLPLSGNLTIANRGLTVALKYAYPYLITFTETGLPVGSNWSVTLRGSTRYTTTGTITFSEPNGTYGYNVGAIAKFTRSAMPDPVRVHGGPASVSVAFRARGGQPSPWTREMMLARFVPSPGLASLP